GGTSTARVLGAFSLSQRLRTFAAGGVDSGDLAFFVGVAVCTTLAAAFVVRPKRMLAVLISIAVALTIVGARTHRFADFTEQQSRPGRRAARRWRGSFEGATSPSASRPVTVNCRSRLTRSNLRATARRPSI